MTSQALENQDGDLEVDTSRRTCSQWSCRSIGVMWSCGSAIILYGFSVAVLPESVQVTKFYVYSFTACLAVSTSPINHVGLLALTCILPIISYHHHHHHRFISHEAAQYNNITFIQGWRGGLVVGRRTCDLVVAGSRPGRDAAA